MRIVGVQMRDFRNYARAEAPVGAGLTVVHGPNGAGKSNLLEALYFGCTARSPRTRNDRELLRFGTRAARVVVALRDADRDRELAVAFGADGAPGTTGAVNAAIKHMTCDGAPVARMADVEDRPLLSVFLPDRLELIKGPPGVRRAHLDQVVAALWPSRSDVRVRYARVLAQRNALLGRIRSGVASQATLPAWDRELAVAALELSGLRERAVAMLTRSFAEHALQLAGGGDAELRYRPRSRAGDEQEFVAELRERLAGDLERGFTGHGPHRDELVLLRDGRELRSYGSQGEQRLALLALLLAEREVLARERGATPVMLLDDVMSELDAARRELLAGQLASGGQSVIATTDLAHVPGAEEAGVCRVHVAAGMISAEALAA